MKDYGPATFGELNAEDYDELHDPGTTDQAIALISKLAGEGIFVFDLHAGLALRSCIFFPGLSFLSIQVQGQQVKG